MHALITPHLGFPILFIVAFIFWHQLNKFIVKTLDLIERNHADHR